VQDINAYLGGEVLVSHHAHLINLACDNLWLAAEAAG